MDQIWLNPVPYYFRSAHVLEDPGYNMAYWNLHERSVSKKDGRYYVNEKSPLVFFHFSGYSIAAPLSISAHQTRYTFADRQDTWPLFVDYTNSLKRNKYDTFSKMTFRLKDNSPSENQRTATGRRVYRYSRSIARRVLNRVPLVRKEHEHKEIFTQIYRKQEWGNEENALYYSGSGSNDSYAIPYVEVVSDFIKKNGVKSVVDLGCGDFRIGSRICQFGDVTYKGVDVVEELIEYNKKKFQNNNVSFYNLNIVKDELPDGELCLIRQVLQHLSNNDIKKILQKARKYKHLIVTEHLPFSVTSAPNLDKDPDGDIRYHKGSGVYLDLPPFNKHVSELLSVEPDDHPNSRIVTFEVTD